MTRPCRGGFRGATIVELLIVIAVISLIMVSVALLIRVSVDYYFYSSDQIEVQRRSLLSLSLLTQEITATNFNSIMTDETMPNPGLIFASSIGPSGGALRDASGRIEWNRLVCYYVDVVDGRSALLRKEEAIPGTNEPPDPMFMGRTIAHFRALPTAGRFMARGVTNLRTERLTDAVRITITAEVREGRNWLEMDVDTTIVPRN